MEHHSTKWYLALAAIAAAAQATALLAVSLVQFATFGHAESRRYVLAALDEFVRVLSGPLLLLYRPGWASWLRPLDSPAPRGGQRLHMGRRPFWRDLVVAALVAARARARTPYRPCSVWSR